MAPAQPFKIAIVGAGAIGSALAGQLALTGQPVALVARGARRVALLRDGLRLKDGAGHVQTAHPAIITPDQLGDADLVVVAVKAQALPELLPQLAARMAPSALLMPAVNGLPWWYFKDTPQFDGTVLSSVDPDGAMLPLFSAERLIGCVVYTRAAIHDDHDVVVHGRQALRIGSVAAGPAPQSLGDQLTAGGIAVSVESNIRREVWRKLVRNASTNLVSGLSGATLEQIGRDEGLVEIILGIGLEVGNLAARLGCPTEEPIDAIIAELHRAGPHITSTLQDIRAGRTPELDALADAPLEIARLAGHDMPILRRLLALLRARLRYLAG